MSRLRPETGTDRLRPVRRLTAAVVIGVLGRVLTGAAVNAFVLYVFGDPATERRRRAVDLPDEVGSAGDPLVNRAGEIRPTRRRGA